ncbi:MAG: putative metal-binding motif-containing protein, partial [Desulfobacterales bacterium]
MPKVFSVSHKGSIPLGGLLCLLFILTSALHISNAHAVTYDLTGNGLGLPEGNYEPSVTVSPELTLSALTSGNATGYPTGIPGIVFLHQTDGAGVRWGDIGNSSKRISGWGIGSYESLVLDFPAGVSAQSITMWFNAIKVYAGGDIIPLDLWVTPFSGTALQISDVVSYLHYTDSDTAYVVFSELPDLTGVGCIERIIARAAPKYHLYVSQITYQSCVDNDNDGYPADSDCDDSDPDVNPGAMEICNGIDDNCDGDIDEGCVTYYRDADGDGYGDPGDSVTATSPPAGYVANAGDCDDADAATYPGASESCNGWDDDCDGTVDEGCALHYRDADGDGYGDPSDSTTVPQSGYVPNAGDCDDGNANVNPGETEICNGVDDNCDGTIDEGCVTYYRDLDSDGYGDPNTWITAMSQPAGYVSNDHDCNDNNASINPGATEVCNSVDDNCDGNIDEGCTSYYRYADGDNYGDPADSVVDTTPPSGYVANSDDCDDTDNTIYPGATELCDGKDNDCDGSTDEGAGCTLHYWDGDSDGYV